MDIWPTEIVTLYYIALDPLGRLTVRRGYAWDGPSGPTIDTKTFMRGSLIHDALYQLIRWGLLPPETKKDADMELKKACIEDGMCRIRAWYVHWSVKRLASYACSPENKKEVLVAP